ncbi:MAG: hypothetical protein RMK18_11035 [Armatimonadota bacterium]|nr:hypothetical protein [Armatimonadota bacterium]MDW8026381.1 hypothetical protein [Armatimonadota bacterium]
MFLVRHGAKWSAVKSSYGGTWETGKFERHFAIVSWLTTSI